MHVVRLHFLFFWICLAAQCHSFTRQQLLRRRRDRLLQSAPSSTTTSSTKTTEDDDNDSSSGAATLRSITFANLPKDGAEPDLLADFLMELGACSATVTDADAGTDAEQPLFSEPSVVGIATTNTTSTTSAWQDSIHWAAPVWNRCNVTAHFGAAADLPSIVEMVQESFPEHVFPSLSSSRPSDSSGGEEMAVQVVPDRDWVIHVQSCWKPIVVLGSKFVLRFPWHTNEDVEEALVQASSSSSSDGVNNDDDETATAVQLFLQGGIAFGTGEHPTTQLCLQWLDRTIAHKMAETTTASTTDSSSGSSSSTHLRVLDYGSGSGVLGMAACKLGDNKNSNKNNFRISATGVDIDVDACRIANQNARENRVDMRNYLPPLWLETADEASKALWLQAHAQVQATQHQRGDDRGKRSSSSSSSSSRQESDKKNDPILWPKDEPSEEAFDVCVANILAGPLITLASTLQSMMKPGAPIGMSGILSPQGADVVQAFSEAGFIDMCVEDELEGWVLVTGRKASLLE